MITNKRKNPLLIPVSQDLLPVLPGLAIFAVSLTASLIFSGTGYFSATGLQLSFCALFISNVFTILYLYIKKKLAVNTLVTVIIFQGIALRICYMLFTDAGTRTYDVYRGWGHLDYIRYIAKHLALPPVNKCQTYHPPVHHIISAIAFNTGKLFTRNEFLWLKLVQAAGTLLNAATLILFYKLLKKLNIAPAALAISVSVFAFHPTNIYFSARINNDNAMLFFYVTAFYFLFCWLNDNSIKNLVLLALFSSLAVLTKLSGIMLFPIIAVVFTINLLKNRMEYRKYIRQFTVFGLIYFPLSLSYQLRNYVLFGQSFGYVPSVGVGFTPNIHNLIGVPAGNMLENPFNNGGLHGGQFFLEFLLKSSLFGEWKYSDLEKPAILLLLLAVLNLFPPLIYLISARKKIIGNREYIFILNLLIPFFLAVKFRTDYPIACSQDFRYIAPVLVSVAYFLGKAVACIPDRFKPVKVFTTASIMAFCALSSAFVLLLAGYD